MFSPFATPSILCIICSEENIFPLIMPGIMNMVA
jgi:hypothetical protein